MAPVRRSRALTTEILTPFSPQGHICTRGLRGGHQCHFYRYVSLAQGGRSSSFSTLIADIFCSLVRLDRQNQTRRHDHQENQAQRGRRRRVQDAYRGQGEPCQDSCRCRLRNLSRHGGGNHRYNGSISDTVAGILIGNMCIGVHTIRMHRTALL